MDNDLALTSFKRLKDYCEEEHYKGWDPYDGLNSKVFQALPLLKKSAFFREVMIQGFKRSPVNLRPLMQVPKEHNAKGIGLFLQGYCNLVKTVRRHPELVSVLGTEDALLAKVSEVADLLVSIQSQGNYHGACWGYNFDWQARGGLFFPKYTPTVVATNFCATALMEAYETTGQPQYLDLALTSADFVIKDLHRHNMDDGSFLFSYSPLKGNDTVYNASLLGSRLLSYCYKYTGREELREAARQSVKACVKGQSEEGSWVYGLLPIQKWVDSFHTGYNLDGLIAFEELTGDNLAHEAIEKGLRFYVEHFFEPDGTPKYYYNQTYPIDIHCPGQLMVTLSRLHKFEEHSELAEKVMDWTIHYMQDEHGYFYYQVKKGISSKISYMRWSNAFMFYAMSYYLLETEDHQNHA